MGETNRTNREMLEEFGLVAEEDLAALLGIGLPSLRQRARDSLPESVRVGRRRFYKEASVRQWLGVPEKPRPAAPKAERRQVQEVQSALRDLAAVEDRLRTMLARGKARVPATQRQYIQLATIGPAQCIFALKAAEEA